MADRPPHSTQRTLRWTSTTRRLERARPALTRSSSRGRDSKPTTGSMTGACESCWRLRVHRDCASARIPKLLWPIPATTRPCQPIRKRCSSGSRISSIGTDHRVLRVATGRLFVYAASRLAPSDWTGEGPLGDLKKTAPVAPSPFALARPSTASTSTRTSF